MQVLFKSTNLTVQTHCTRTVIHLHPPCQWLVEMAGRDLDIYGKITDLHEQYNCRITSAFYFW